MTAFGSNVPDRLRDLPVPLLQAPMGAVSSPAMACAVAAAGAVGSVGLYRTIDTTELHRIGRKLARASGQVAVGLVPELLPDNDVRRQITTIAAATRPGTWWLTFGPLSDDVAGELCATRRPWLAQVGTVAEAHCMLERGATGIIGQGVEAGGRQLGSARRDQLLRDLRMNFPAATIGAAGGVTSAREIRRTTELGADFACAGTLFVASTESNAHRFYQQQVVDGMGCETVITDAFSIGWPRRHRVLRRCLPSPTATRLSRIGTRHGTAGPEPVFSHTPTVPTHDFRGDVSRLALYAGTGIDAITRTSSCSDIIERLAAKPRPVTTPTRRRPS